ncbi:MAG: tRNA (adenosine(37)-N6)-threonylcarbamoyltransferase complex transferase subunit TsaD [Parcubacteria group bacterium]|jgi:N6-L-threonylcarbamoyladenine synthase|nr:tRNA (adenosine(37)-N6)-threonylcarbamoyltransferase complex transferase subunit TsaD [Parcubacteria group bacterium]|tara:strand:+ start:43 stop:1218 length:1176 start_codon:yes stop_codon:yes gene_type:complete
MKILAIETSCDETAIAVLEGEGGFENPKFKLIANNLLSQIEVHREYGGVFPSLAKREHSKNLVPILEKTLKEGNLLQSTEVESFGKKRIEEILEREPELLRSFLYTVPKIKKPGVDYIAVTYGPGLEPALWVGINFAKALSLAWDIPLIPVNHMEGHILSVLYDGKGLSNSNSQFPNKIKFPALALLISGGHTELVLMKDWLQYEIIGETQDDAVGEAFDKIARMMNLPYPGGPEISKLAETKRGVEFENQFNLPKPMIDSPNCHFSFSGLKTSILYKIKNLNLDKNTKAQMAKEFEDTVVNILLRKTKKAIGESNVKTLIIGGGVIANKEIRKAFQEFSEKEKLNLLIPEMKLTTDNAIMIGIAGYFQALRNPKGADINGIEASGNLRLI